jgi:hypothetical protein
MACLGRGRRYLVRDAPKLWVKQKRPDIRLSLDTKEKPGTENENRLSACSETDLFSF